MNDATWPTFIAAPFIWPSTSKICSAASIWRLEAAAYLASSPRVRFAAFVAYPRAAWPPASFPTFAALLTLPVGRSFAIGDQSTRKASLRTGHRPVLAHYSLCPMRLVSFLANGHPRAALLRNGCVYDIWGDASRGARSTDRTLEAILEGGLIDEIEPVEGDDGVPVEGLELLPPVTRPGKILCIGLNYRAHAEEQGAEPPETPTFFAKFRNALAAPGASVPLPEWSQRVDYEAEVAFVIKDRCKDVSEAEAMDHVAGYTLLNDLSARDYQFKTPQWMPGKTFDGAAPCGPALVTPDEAGPHDAIEIELTLNGEVMQKSSTADLVHSVPALVVYLSQLMTLEPGDLVSTGTPAGVGSLRDPKVWLKPGDEVVISSPQLGVLETRLA
jgi:2-keto-4-pentenoate hydratase/2-oxohepta-3-ene-1,7-dioic acid hydratase in catechol pathway